MHDFARLSVGDTTAPSASVGHLDAPSLTPVAEGSVRFVDTPLSSRMWIGKVAVCVASHRLLDDDDYGPGIVIDEMATNPLHLRKGHAMTMLHHLHAMVPDGNLYALETTPEGEHLRRRYEESTGLRYINFDHE